MVQLGTLDLEILNLAIKKNGRFNEKDIENSELKRLGVGRLLDELASLKDRNLIEMNHDGSFSVTKFAKQILWSSDIPLWVRTLRLLEIKSNPINEISNILDESEEKLSQVLENLRKSHLVLMSPVRNETQLIKMYEILQDGINILRKGEKEGFKENIFENKIQNVEILQMIDDIITELEHELKDDIRDKILKKLLLIKSKLKI